MLPPEWTEGALTVQSAVPTDAPALHALFRECTDTFPSDPTFTKIPESEIAALIDQSSADQHEEQGFRLRSLHYGPERALAGYFHLTEGLPGPQDIWMSILAIRPAFRRSGVGTTAMQSLLDVLAERGYHTVRARVYLANVPALKFWTALGFREIVRHRNAYIGSDEGRDCMVLAAHLKGNT